jgi:hypothetical protein
MLALSLHRACIAIGLALGAKDLPECDHLVVEFIQSLLIKCAKSGPQIFLDSRLHWIQFQ